MENPLTTDGAGAVDVAAEGETVAVAPSHSSSVGDRDDDAANGSQKSQLDGGGGGGGRQGEAVTEVYVSELGLIVGGAGGRRVGRAAGVCFWWWWGWRWGRESAKWRRAAPVERRERR